MQEVIYADPEELRAAYWPRVQVGAQDECWPWTGYITDSGYGIAKVRVVTDAGVRWTNQRAHRTAYQLSGRTIPDGMELDHTCHVAADCKLGGRCPHRRCCNPAHAEPVDRQTNRDRANPSPGRPRPTHCPQGHDYADPKHRRIGQRGEIRCRTCHADFARANRRAK